LEHDEHLRLLEDLLGIEIFARGNVVKLKGEPLKIEKRRKHLIIFEIESIE